MNNWEQIDYQTIEDAAVNNGVLTTTFTNGDVVDIPLSSLLSLSEVLLKKIDDEDIHNNSYEIEILVNEEPYLIPWDKIRVLTDKDFSKFLAQQAEEQAKLIGVKLKRLREKKGLKSNDLADRSGITAQSISRIEKGHQDVSFTTLRKLLASMGYSLADLANEEVELENEKSADKTFSFLLKKLSKIGIEPSFVTKKIIPKSLQLELGNLQLGQPDLLLDEAASYLSNIYGWRLNDIWSNSELNFDESNVNLALFKKGSRSNYNQIKAYVPYANFLARIVIKANHHVVRTPRPKDIEDFKQTLNTVYGGLTLSAILNYAWDMGICVIPLKDSGIFHGVAWNINGKPVIVLKQQVVSHAKWIFDLLHELYHVLVHLKEDNEIILETSEISPNSKDEDPREREANSFASQVIFNGNPEKFAQEAVTIAKGKIEFLRSAVEDVAERNQIRVDALANYLAHRLAYQGNQWWSIADGLQEKDPEPFEIAQEILLQNIEINNLTSMDYNLLATALNV
jgi:transcriptional regulator with XRE-family HTH domain